MFSDLEYKLFNDRITACKTNIWVHSIKKNSENKEIFFFFFFYTKTVQIGLIAKSDANGINSET